jgi:hypothetical protein
VVIKKEAVMAKKIVICAHGVGRHRDNFHETWAEVLNINHNSDKFVVKGLFWDDLQDQLFDKFYDIEEKIRDVAEETFLKTAYKYLDEPSYKSILDFIQENIFNAVSYLFFKEFRDAILWPKCIIRLMEIIKKYKSYQPVLIGHSLGSILLTHITWFIRQTTGILNYYDFFLIGSPIGFRSPLNAIPDFLELLAKIGNHPSRMDALTIWAQEWWHYKRNRLHIIINELDPIAWNVKMDIGSNKDINIIPVHQGLSDKEIKRIEAVNVNIIKRFKLGSKKIIDIFNNNNVENYLNSDPFKQAFDTIL